MTTKNLIKAMAAGAALAAATLAGAAELEMEVGGKTYPITLADHPGTASLMAQLPVTVVFEDTARPSASRTSPANSRPPAPRSRRSPKRATSPTTSPGGTWRSS